MVTASSQPPLEGKVRQDYNLRHQVLPSDLLVQDVVLEGPRTLDASQGYQIRGGLHIARGTVGDPLLGAEMPAEAL